MSADEVGKLGDQSEENRELFHSWQSIPSLSIEEVERLAPTSADDRFESEASAVLRIEQELRKSAERLPPSPTFANPLISMGPKRTQQHRAEAEAKTKTKTTPKTNIKTKGVRKIFPLLPPPILKRPLTFALSGRPSSNDSRPSDTRTTTTTTTTNKIGLRLLPKEPRRSLRT